MRTHEPDCPGRPNYKGICNCGYEPTMKVQTALERQLLDDVVALSAKIQSLREWLIGAIDFHRRSSTAFGVGIDDEHDAQRRSLECALSILDHGMPDYRQRGVKP